MAADRPDLKPLVGQKVTLTAWLWARTVKSPNPAFSSAAVPLVSSFLLCEKAGKEAYVEPIIEGAGYRFAVRTGRPQHPETTNNGTKSGSGGSSFVCLLSGTPMPFDYLRSEGKAGRMGVRLMATVADGPRGRLYLAPTAEAEAAAEHVQLNELPHTELPLKALGFRVQEYGLTRWCDLFTHRQLGALETFCTLVKEVQEKVTRDALAAGMPDDGCALERGGAGATAYADAISILAAFAVDKLAVYNNGFCTWNPTNQNINQIFTKQTVSMVWDFSEASPICGGLSFEELVSGVAGTVELLPASAVGKAYQMDCAASNGRQNYPAIISTDPPYYDNMGYADLSDFFYYWLRLSLRSRLPDLFSTLLVPKGEELIASPHRHQSKEEADKFFMDGMTRAMHELAREAHPCFPVTIYYAYKQSETKGWETFLTAVVNAGFAVTGTWPIRTERKTRPRGQGSNALASSVILVCRPRLEEAVVTTRRDFLNALKSEMPGAVRRLQHSNIAPVDLPQSAIGPGMAVYTRYAKVLDTNGNAVTVHEALSLINDILDEVLSAQDGDFDSATRWALAWFEQYGFASGEYGIAENISKAKSTSIPSLARAGILASKGGTVRLFQPAELSTSWDPRVDPPLIVWEVAHQMIRVLETSGEGAAADLMAKIGSKAEAARDLSYRLYTICVGKKRAREGLSYNGLVQSWPEIARLARDGRGPSQGDLFEDDADRDESEGDADGDQ